MALDLVYELVLLKDFDLEPDLELDLELDLEPEKDFLKECYLVNHLVPDLANLLEMLLAP